MPDPVATRCRPRQPGCRCNSSAGRPPCWLCGGGIRLLDQRQQQPAASPSIASLVASSLPRGSSHQTRRCRLGGGPAFCSVSTTPSSSFFSRPPSSWSASWEISDVRVFQRCVYRAQALVRIVVKDTSVALACGWPGLRGGADLMCSASMVRGIRQRGIAFDFLMVRIGAQLQQLRGATSRAPGRQRPGATSNTVLQPIGPPAACGAAAARAANTSTLEVNSGLRCPAAGERLIYTCSPARCCLCGSRSRRASWHPRALAAHLGADEVHRGVMRTRRSSAAW